MLSYSLTLYIVNARGLAYM